jgi:hypothetical protein
VIKCVSSLEGKESVMEIGGVWEMYCLRGKKRVKNPCNDRYY